MKQLALRGTAILPLLFCTGNSLLAHSIDYLAASISPAASFNGNSGNFALISPVQGGTQIGFSLTFSVNTNGNTTSYPATVSFGATTQIKPTGAADAVVTGLANCSFVTPATTCISSVTVTAPATPGNYVVKIAPTSGTGGSGGLQSGGGITFGFTVAPAPNPTVVKVPTTLTLSLAAPCLVYKTPTDVFSATLTAGGAPLANITIDFTVDGNPAGSSLTDQNGVATVTFNSSVLTVGDHAVNASFAGNLLVGNNLYGSSQNTLTLSVEYNFLGFQQPINADGSSIFNGKVIPVKIRLSDYSGGPVVNADAHVFFGYVTPALTGTTNEAVPIGNTSGDLGNLMRYDPTANQYVFNWDESSLANGTYRVRIDLAEGGCATPHVVTLSLGKKK